MPRLLIVAGELSGDIHGAALARALQQTGHPLTLLGVGGANMRAAGVELIRDITDLDVVGTLGFRQTVAVARTFALIRRVVKTIPPDLVILVDNPGLNLRVATMVKKHGISVIYYVSPQIWAWHYGRIRLIARVVDHMIVIFPFEEELYKRAGVPCTFVGHPMIDELEAISRFTKEESRDRLALDRHHPVIAVLPGSRAREVKAHLPLMLEALVQVRREVFFQAVLPAAPSVDGPFLATVCRRFPLDVKIVQGHAADVMNAADVVVVSSGTATLQAGVLGVPMVVLYRTSWLTYLLARALVRIQWIGLVNIVMGRSIVPELVQHHATPSRLSAAVCALLADKAEYERMKNELAHVRRKLGPPGASVRAAGVVLRYLAGC